MTVNYETGEIVEPGTDLAPVDKTAASVVTVLERAKSWLSTAVEMTGPEEIAAAKAQIRTAEVYARELHLSKEIQLDAQEMVRRAEYALGKSIRKGQAEGTIRTRGQRGPQTDYTRTRDGRQQHIAVTADSGNCLPGVKDIAPDFYDNGSEMAALSNGVSDEQFDAAIEEAKAEGNLGRANVVRKVKGQAGPATRDQRADLIVKLANEGYSSRQMPAKVGVTEETVRQIAREYGIDIPADKAITRTRRINSTQLVVNTATALEGLVSGVELIDYDALDNAEVSQWATSLTDSMRVLNRFVKQIKEIAQ